MDRHAEWIEARHELSEASKVVDYWNTMPSHMRVQIGASRYREKRTEARQRFRRADRACHAAAAERRTSQLPGDLVA